MEAAALRIGEIQLALGAGDAHVTQAPLFLETALFGDGHLMGEQALFHAADEHQGEFQALGGVQGHQLHAIFPFIALSLARFQGGMGKKGGEGVDLTVFFALKLSGGTDQLLQVLDPRLAYLAFFLAIVIEQAAVMDDMLHLVAQVQGCGVGGEAFDRVLVVTLYNTRCP